MLINLASGALIGLMLGLAVAIVRERTDRVLRRTTDTSRRFDLPVLAELPPRVKPMLNDIYPISGTAGRTFGRLRNEIVASLDEDQRVIVVSGASRGATATVVAANIACSFARAGERVVLIGANVVPGAPLSAASSTSTPPPACSTCSPAGWQLADALQRAARCPGLGRARGGWRGQRGGLFQAEAIRRVLDELLRQADFIVIEAPSTAVDPDAQTLASLADAAIITVEVRRTTHAEISDAAEQFRRVCPVVLGAVAMARFDSAPKESPARDLPALGSGPAGAGTVASMRANTAETQIFASVDKSISDDLDSDGTSGKDGNGTAPDSSTMVIQRLTFEELEVTGVDGFHQVRPRTAVRARRRCAGLVMFAIIAALAGCTDSTPPLVAPIPSMPASASPTDPPAPFGLAPLTSLPASSTTVAGRLAVAVAITMRSGAPSPVGLSDADYVYEEVTAAHNHRLVAIFQSRDATRIGPVGPPAPMDRHLLPVLRPIVANSGDPARFTKRLDTTKSVVDRTFPVDHAAYISSGSWLYTSTSALYTKAPAGLPPGNLQSFVTSGLRMTTLTDKATSSISVTIPGDSKVVWTDDTTHNTWVRTSPDVAVTNLIIMIMPYETVPVTNKRGAATVRSATIIGQGTCLIASGGFSSPCTWTQRPVDAVPDILDANGYPVRLSPGHLGDVRTHRFHD